MFSHYWPGDGIVNAAPVVEETYAARQIVVLGSLFLCIALLG